MAYSGKFSPIHEDKYIGDVSNITYRSLWELRVLKFLDKSPSVLNYSSEEIIIPYISPFKTETTKRYFPDFYVKYKRRDGSVREEIWEVKPRYQAEAPVKPKRVTKRYINEVITYGINQAKWEAAEKFCADRGWTFRVLTEKELGIE